MKAREMVALVDLDGTLADYDEQLRKDMALLCAPGEPDPGTDHHNAPPHIQARMNLIRRAEGWWLNLPRYEPGFQIVDILREFGFQLHVLTKGPTRTVTAWTEKVQWVQKNLPDAGISIVTDKGLTYGRILVDDFPAYAERWLEWRPRGLVIMPAHTWNEDFDHVQVFRFTGTPENIKALRQRLVVFVSAARFE